MASTKGLYEDAIVTPLPPIFTSMMIVVRLYETETKDGSTNVGIHIFFEIGLIRSLLGFYNHFCVFSIIILFFLSF